MLWYSLLDVFYNLTLRKQFKNTTMSQEWDFPTSSKDQFPGPWVNLSLLWLQLGIFFFAQKKSFIIEEGFLSCCWGHWQHCVLFNEISIFFSFDSERLHNSEMPKRCNIHRSHSWRKMLCFCTRFTKKTFFWIKWKQKLYALDWALSFWANGGGKQRT